ncbi:ATP-binding cassette domain-containing protein, partial [Enterobacter hormaechei]|uniref:ATP-binding cassette domain-containing protein n=1 Tax=Enterobacter hormaechei TaxID=158836 RepID=UPI001952CD54
PVMQPIISISGLSKTYGSSFHALKSINLDISRGEIFALLGPNGAGKTTLFTMISGFERPTAGRILFEGRDITGQKPEALALMG